MVDIPCSPFAYYGLRVFLLSTKAGEAHRYRLSISYDSIDNIVAKQQAHEIAQRGGTVVAQQKTTYNWTYAYAGLQPHAPTYIGDRTFTYDANGNQTGWTNDQNGTRRSIVWDEENRIRSIFDNGQEETYKYDAAAERVIKRGPQGETVYVNQYYTVRNGALATKHVFAGDTRFVSKLVKQNASEKDQYYYDPDRLGSTNYVTDANGQPYEHLEYFPFGETWVDEASNTQRAPYLFTGKELDEETGLYYFGARYYDPRTGQFISADPLYGAEPARLLLDSESLDLYSYAGENPIRYVDLDGLGRTPGYIPARHQPEFLWSGRITKYVQQRAYEGRHILRGTLSDGTKFVAISGKGGHEGHTEPVAIKQLIAQKKLKQGDKIDLEGVLAPCGMSCHGGMHHMAKKANLTIRYQVSQRLHKSLGMPITKAEARKGSRHYEKKEGFQAATKRKPKVSAAKDFWVRMAKQVPKR